MIDVAEAEKIILSNTFTPNIIEIPLELSIDRVLQEDVFTDTDFPPFDRIMMDGIAINFDEYENGRREFKVAGIQAAGKPQQTLIDKTECLEAMTGAILPNGTDTIIQYELLEFNDEKTVARINDEDIERGRNIHNKGTDKKAGDLLIKKGVIVSAAELAVMASVGKTSVKVSQHPRVAVISTGDELVEIDQEPLPHQIRRSNIYAIQAELNKLGLKCSKHHLNDEKDELEKSILKILEDHEVLILSGGVSMGKFDFVPEVLDTCGVKKLFHKIKQKPGKPFWFGVRDQKNVAFAFPGNPVSTFMCFHRYFKPWLMKSMEIAEVKKYYAVLNDSIDFKAPLTYFLQVKTHFDQNANLCAQPIVGRGSGDHANLLEADGFLEIPGGSEAIKKGQVFRYFPFRN